MKLNIVTVRGHRFYFLGELPSEAIKSAEELCISLEASPHYTVPQKQFTTLLNHIKSTYDFPVEEITIGHIFRINF